MNIIYFCRKALLLFCLAMTNSVFAQLSDDFNNGVIAPVWKGERDEFSINSSAQLQLNAVGAGTSDLYTPLQLTDDMYWSFYLRLTFNTSKNNHTVINLYADSLAASTANNRLFLQIGKEYDSLQLFYKKGMDLLKLRTFAGLQTNTTNNELFISVARQPSGVYYFQIKNGKGILVNDTIMVNDTLPSTSFFIWQCIYTSSNATRFYLDDVMLGEVPVDTNVQVVSDTALPGDLLISEVLFNPKSDCIDFIELQNISNKVLDLSQVSLAGWNEVLDIVSESYTITQQRCLLLPNEYIVLSNDHELIRICHQITDTFNYVDMTSFPPMNNDQGVVVLTGLHGEILDKVSYSERMHFKMIDDIEGVSLERVNADGYYWHSASSVSGFATPGKKNSQNYEKVDAAKMLEITPGIFSPDNDGYQDLLGIQYKLTWLDAMITLKIYSDRGYLVKDIWNNESVGSSGEVFWDGLDQQQHLCEPGIYIVWMDVFTISGERKTERKAIVLAN